MAFVLALDQGTTSSRALVFDGRGRAVSMARQEFRQIYPRPGWVEHDPDELWRSQLACAHEALRRARVPASRLAGIGISNQRETTLIWERASGRPVHHAIVWQDRRTAGHCERLAREGLGPLVRRRTGLVIDPYFSATKIAWLLARVPGLRVRARRGELAFGTVDSWLLWKLTRGRLHATDVTNASRTLLYDIKRARWDEDLLRLFDVPPRLLPEVLPSSHLYGMSDRSIFGTSVPIAGIAGDQQAALFGQACHQPGMAKNTYGTGCFLLLNTGSRAIASRNGLVSTAAASPGQYALEGSIFIAGAVVQWLRDGLHLIRTAREVEALAASVPDSGGVCFVPAFTGLGAPYWDPNARGTIVGMTRATNAGHVARAALESIACQSTALLRAMREDSGVTLKELRVDGGAAANDLLMQIQADLLGVTVVRPRILETTALGAAYLAGLATGVWKDVRQIARQWRPQRRFEPRMRRADAGRLMGEWARAAERSRNWQRA